jgi:hypothetical protein
VTADRPETDVALQFSVLEEAWDNVQRHWHDDVARDFAAQHWTPLKQESAVYLQALRSLLDTLSAVGFSDEA